MLIDTLDGLIVITQMECDMSDYMVCFEPIPDRDRSHFVMSNTKQLPPVEKAEKSELEVFTAFTKFYDDPVKAYNKLLELGLITVDKEKVIPELKAIHETHGKLLEIIKTNRFSKESNFTAGEIILLDQYISSYAYILSDINKLLYKLTNEATKV